MKIETGPSAYSTHGRGEAPKSQTQVERTSDVAFCHPMTAPFPLGRPQYSQTLYELVHLLNMARPEGLEGMEVGKRIVAPGMTLALRSDGPRRPVANAMPSDVEPRLVTVEERAQGVLDQIGDGKEVYLDQAEALLLWQSETHQTNNAETLRRYFERLDRDRSGGLGFEELRDLIAHYDRTNTHDEAPRLPATWV